MMILSLISMSVLFCGVSATDWEHYYVAAYENLGCWADKRMVNAIANAEDNPLLGDENYNHRELAISKCARVAENTSSTIFALQSGGRCSTSCNAELRYKIYGESDNCSMDGKGGRSANQVYRLTSFAKVSLTNLGCWEDRQERAMVKLEDVVLDGIYTERSLPLAKCVQAAYKHGYRVIGMQNGGDCWVEERGSYDKYGPSELCNNDGLGGLWASEVYKIVIVQEQFYQEANLP